MSEPAYLPELQISSDFELLKASLQVELERLWLSEVGPVTLVAIFVQVRQMVPKNLAQPSELRGPFVLEAELECPMRSHLCSNRKKQRALIQQRHGLSLLLASNKQQPGQRHLRVPESK